MSQVPVVRPSFQLSLFCMGHTGPSPQPQPQPQPNPPFLKKGFENWNSGGFPVFFRGPDGFPAGLRGAPGAVF